MQKALTEMNIQLANVISDISGMTGMAILRAIVSGERNPQALARLKNERIQASRQEIAQSLEGNWRPELLFVLDLRRFGLASYTHRATCAGAVPLLNHYSTSNEVLATHNKPRMILRATAPASDPTRCFAENPSAIYSNTTAGPHEFVDNAGILKQLRCSNVKASSPQPRHLKRRD